MPKPEPKPRTEGLSLPRYLRQLVLGTRTVPQAGLSTSGTEPYLSSLRYLSSLHLFSSHLPRLSTLLLYLDTDPWQRRSQRGRELNEANPG